MNNDKGKVCGDHEIMGCLRESELDLTKAGIMTNWLPTSEFDGVPESVQELGSHFSQGNEMSRLRLKLAESGVTIQSRCTSL